MAKASLTIPNGPSVQIDGTPEEIKRLLDFYSDASVNKTARHTAKGVSRDSAQRAKSDLSPEQVDITTIVNALKECDELDAIEKNIMDKSNVLNRVLLPLYIVHKYLNSAYGLTSGEISKVTAELGIPVSQPNTSHTLSDETKYVIGNRVKVKGQAVRYKLSRRGAQHLQMVLSGAERDE